MKTDNSFNLNDPFDKPDAESMALCRVDIGPDDYKEGWMKGFSRREIEFFEEQDDADRWMDELFRDLRAEAAAKNSTEETDD